MADHTLDTSGLTCPIPILKTKKALAAIAPGETLAVIATDPAAPKDIEAFCRATGHALLEKFERDDRFFFVIARAP